MSHLTTYKFGELFVNVDSGKLNPAVLLGQQWPWLAAGWPDRLAGIANHLSAPSIKR